MYGGVQLFGGGTSGALITGAVAVVILAYLFILARRDPVTADNVVEVDEVTVAAPDFTARGAGAPA